MPAQYSVRCVCGAHITIKGHYIDTLSGRKHFIDDHRECREKLDAEIKRENKINTDSFLFPGGVKL